VSRNCRKGCCCCCCCCWPLLPQCEAAAAAAAMALRVALGRCPGNSPFQLTQCYGSNSDALFEANVVRQKLLTICPAVRTPLDLWEAARTDSRSLDLLCSRWKEV
jgi:hypothetical protein